MNNIRRSVGSANLNKSASNSSNSVTCSDEEEVCNLINQALEVHESSPTKEVPKKEKMVEHLDENISTARVNVQNCTNNKWANATIIELTSAKRNESEQDPLIRELISLPKDQRKRRIDDIRQGKHLQTFKPETLSKVESKHLKIIHELSKVSKLAPITNSCVEEQQQKGLPPSVVTNHRKTIDESRWNDKLDYSPQPTQKFVSINQPTRPLCDLLPHNQNHKLKKNYNSICSDDFFKNNQNFEANKHEVLKENGREGDSTVEEINLDQGCSVKLDPKTPKWVHNSKESKPFVNVDTESRTIVDVDKTSNVKPVVIEETPKNSSKLQNYPTQPKILFKPANSNSNAKVSSIKTSNLPTLPTGVQELQNRMKKMEKLEQLLIKSLIINLQKTPSEHSASSDSTSSSSSSSSSSSKTEETVMIHNTTFSYDFLDEPDIDDRILQRVPYYWGKMSRSEAEEVILKHRKRKGAFLLRYSVKEKDLVLSVWDKANATTRHIRLFTAPDGKVSIREENRSIQFNTVDALIDYHKDTGRPLLTHLSTVLLKHPITKP